MAKATLAIMAAGMGSRFGGLKQMEPIGPNGEVLADYSIFDAIHAGFDKIVFIIKKEIEEDFVNIVINKFNRNVEIELVRQELTDLPANAPKYAVDAAKNGRKPWGTGHAVACCFGAINEPFMVINADDFYGRSAFVNVFNYITSKNIKPYEYCMAGYLLENTVSEKGRVSRGICETSNGFLQNITERKDIFLNNSQIFFEEDGQTHQLLPSTVVSMSAWGFQPDFLNECRELFSHFLSNNDENTITKTEYYLPWAVEQVLRQKNATVAVLPCSDKWHGFTHKEDRPLVEAAIKKYIQTGVYPTKLWQ